MIDQEKFEAILSRYKAEPSSLMPVLHELMDAYHYLPKEELKAVAEGLHVPLSQVYSVATFYKGFSLKPQGVHHVQVCRGTACHLQGSQRLQGVARRLGLEPGHTTPGWTVFPGESQMRRQVRRRPGVGGGSRLFRRGRGRHPDQNPQTLPQTQMR